MTDNSFDHTLTDSFGRDITYLRLSVTDRCDLRCVYCMAEDMTFLPRKDVLTIEELEGICSIFIARGVRKIRLMTNNPKKRIGLIGYGLEILENVPIEVLPNEHNLKYLTTKRDKLGHEILKDMN